MVSLRIVPLNFRHIHFFVEHIRPEDIAECLVTHGDNPLDMTINEYIQAGAMALVNQKDEVLAIAGVHEGIMWLLGTTLMETNKVAFMRWSKTCMLPQLLKVNKYMFNITWKVNSLHYKWLKWLGCIVLEENDDFVLFAFDQSSLKDGENNV